VPANTISTNPSAAALLISKIKIARYFKPLQEMLFLFQMTFSFLELDVLNLEPAWICTPSLVDSDGGTRLKSSE
jgi:hypothetical protein